VGLPAPAEAGAFRRLDPVEPGGKTIASTTRAWRVLEPSHPPTYYLPRDRRASAAGSLGRSSACSGAFRGRWAGSRVRVDGVGNLSTAGPLGTRAATLATLLALSTAPADPDPLADSIVPACATYTLGRHAPWGVTGRLGTAATGRGLLGQSQT
jgi:hypothetical protein